MPIQAPFLFFSALPKPPSELSKPFRNWSYYNPSGGFVVPPNAGNFRGQTLTDTAVVFEKAEEDTLPGRWRMTYLFFNGSDPGYEVALAISDDLLHWSFNRGGADGIVFPRSANRSAYDFGGVTLGGLHFTSAGLRARRTLRKAGTPPAYHGLYGCYPSRAGYEAGDGGQGMAQSADGVSWTRVSTSVPALAGSSPASPAWEDKVVYQPYLVEHGSTFYDFYNARGTNRFGATAEQSGFATLAAAEFPGVQPSGSLWKADPRSPVLPSGPKGSDDTAMASDPKVYWDEQQQVWATFYFGLGDGTAGHAVIMMAFSTDLITWEKDPAPLSPSAGTLG
jgi:hypothetical protein